jgi:hypothetical protein
MAMHQLVPSRNKRLLIKTNGESLSCSTAHTQDLCVLSESFLQWPPSTINYRCLLGGLFRDLDRGGVVEMCSPCGVLI